ncbi:polysaccharide pyruvyl transferase family protein, partial [Bordetella tumbae]
LVSHISGLNLERLSKDNIIESELLAVGSILHWAPERDKPYPVWGSGTLGADPLNSGLFKVNLLRGPLTKSLLDIQGNIPFGDPGLLASQVWERSNEEKYDWGIIPHWSQKDSPWVKRLLKDTKNSIVINVNNPDMTQIMSQISSCKHIAATSLHGLVIADSYRIPSVWLWEDNSTRRVQWKYFDYFAGIGRNNIKNVNINKIESLAKIKLNSDEYAYFDKLDSVCSRIISAFPL